MWEGPARGGVLGDERAFWRRCEDRAGLSQWPCNPTASRSLTQAAEEALTSRPKKLRLLKRTQATSLVWIPRGSKQTMFRYQEIDCFDWMQLERWNWNPKDFGERSSYRSIDRSRDLTSKTSGPAVLSEWNPVQVFGQAGVAIPALPCKNRDIS